MLLATRSTPIRWLHLSTLASCLAVGACGTTNTDTLRSDEVVQITSGPATTLTTVNKSIASDIVKAASQIFPAFSTTLQFNNNQDDAMLQHFSELFSSAGFGVQRVSADQGSHFFSYTLEEQSSNNAVPLLKFNATIANVEISRDYQVPRANTISPAGPVRLSGTRVPVQVADTPSDTFEVKDDYHSRAVYVASLNLDEQSTPLISLITDDVVSGVASRSQSNVASFSALNSSRVETANLFHTNESNFASVFDGRERVLQQFIVFGNDSMVLGNTNKLLIEQLLNNNLNDEDVISLIGCSTGYTALDIGNEGLALGRAKRVVEALLTQGIARERILDEGCWAPESGTTDLPNRGVMLEIWRQNT